MLEVTFDAELIANGDWEKDARYHYYEHGPLARVEIGNEQLQGVDYVYNLQGWMKGVNSSTLDPAADPGKDASAGPNNTFAPDIVGFSLHYFDNDYAAIGGVGNAATIAVGSHAEGHSAALYNGNIRYMQTAITDATITSGTTQNYAALPMLNAYQYDQLNRLKAARSYETGLASGIWNPTSYSNSYLNTFIYDAMGNIEYQDRYNRAGVQLEDMDYQYHETSGGDKISNRLYHINDLIDSLIASNDIDDQYAFTPHSTTTNINGSNNYVYDEEGRLIKDKAEEISSIVWRVDGKVKEINRPSTSTKKKLKFDYDAMGNRIAKHVFDNQTGLLERSTYYILDAQGNQLTTYEHVVDNSTANFVLKERHIFGSSRLGMLNEDVNVLTAQIGQNVQHEVGKKYYELSNHLGNVLSVFTDLKIPQSSNTVTVSSYRVYIAGTTDYSPFGVELDGRTQSPEAYRYGYNGMEGDDELKGQGNSYTTEFRQLDPRLGRWLSLDPKMSSFPWQSPYCSMDNNPISLTDPKGSNAGDYFDSQNGEYLGTDGVNDGLEHKIDKKDFVAITSDQNYQKSSNEDKKGWLLGQVDKTSSNHEFSINAGCVGTPKSTGSKPSNSRPPQSTGSKKGDASSFVDGAGAINDVVTDGTEIAHIPLSPSAKGFTGGAGAALTVYEAAELAEQTGEAIAEYNSTGNSEPLKKALVDDGLFVFETTVVDRALTSGNPYAMAAAAIYYTGKFIISHEGGEVGPTPAIWFYTRDQDNTRTMGTAGPGF